MELVTNLLLKAKQLILGEWTPSG